MKTQSILLILFLNFFVLPLYGATFHFENKPDFLATLVSPVWKSLPYSFQLDSTDFPDEESTINLAVQKGKITLGKKEAVLFSLDPAGNNKINLLWNLDRFSADITVRVRFIFKKLGVRVVHDEDYRIQGQEIHNAITQLQLIKKSNQPLKLNILSNQNFAIKNVELTPQGGVGQTLKWIFDNVLSEEKVNEIITEAINKEIQKWADSDDLMEEISQGINRELSELKKRKFPLPNIASILSFEVEELSMSKSQTSLQLKTYLFPISEKLHPCVQHLAPFDKNDAQFSFELMEEVVRHLTTLPRTTQDGIKAPVLCLGYDDYVNGSPIGHAMQVKVLGKMIDFKSWVKPLVLPEFTYDVPNQIFQIKTRVAGIVKRNLYPQINSGTEPIDASVTAQFKLTYLPNLGLVMNYQNMNVDQISGHIRLKWARFLPGFKISLKWVKSFLVQELQKGMERDFHERVVLKEKIPFIGKTFLNLTGYRMENDGHHFNFEFQNN